MSPLTVASMEARAAAVRAEAVGTVAARVSPAVVTVEGASAAATRATVVAVWAVVMRSAAEMVTVTAPQQRLP